MTPSTSRQLINITPNLPVKQMEFSLVEFQELTGLGNTNTMELIDALPLYLQQPYSMPTDAPRVENVEFRKQRLTATVKPAGIVKDGRMHYTFAGMREKWVETVLRKMLSEPGPHVQFTRAPGGEEIPSLYTTLYAIRKRLAAIGHGYKLSEIRDALRILGDTRFFLTFVDGNGKLVDLETENSIIGYNARTPHADTTGSDTRVRITLHPLVVKSIVDRTYRQLDWKQYIQIKRPGAQWLYSRIIHHFTGVDRVAGPMSRPYNIDLETILAGSGMRRYRSADGEFLVKENIRQVRRDLAELVERGVLIPLRPYVEKLKRYREKGKRGPARIAGAVWDLYVSQDTTDHIITTNKRMQRPKHQVAVAQISSGR